MHCPKCLKQLAEGAVSCPHCGARAGASGEVKSRWRLWLLAILAVLFLAGAGGYTWFSHISNAEKLAVEQYLPAQETVESRFKAHIRNGRFADVVVLAGTQERPQEQHLWVISFNAYKFAWEVIYDKPVPKFIRASAEVCKLLPGEKQQILIQYRGGGTGGFLDYSVLGWENGEMKTYLDRNMLPMGKVEVQENQLLETSTTGNRLYQWLGNAFIATLLAGDPIKPVGSNDVVVEYEIIDDHTVKVSQNEITMYVGQKLRFVCNSTRRAARIMYSGNTWNFTEGASVAKESADTVVQILPTYGGWEDAAKVYVSIKER